MRILFYAVLLIALLLVARPLAAQTTPDDRPLPERRVPAETGATGLLRIPSAAVQRDGQVTAFLAGGSGAGTGGVTLGVGGRGEAGVTVADGGGSRLRAGAKWNLVPEQLIVPGVSVGVTGIGAGGKNATGAYVVASKTLIPYFVNALTGRETAVTLHLGYGGGIYNHNVFAGTELFLLGRVSALAEITGGRLSAGGRFYARGLQATAGWLGGERWRASVSVTTSL